MLELVLLRIEYRSGAGTLGVPLEGTRRVGGTAWQDEALARDGVSREVPCSALKGETVPDPNKAEEGREDPCSSSSAGSL